MIADASDAQARTYDICAFLILSCSLSSLVVIWKEYIKKRITSLRDTIPWPHDCQHHICGELLDHVCDPVVYHHHHSDCILFCICLSCDLVYTIELFSVCVVRVQYPGPPAEPGSDSAQDIHFLGGGLVCQHCLVHNHGLASSNGQLSQSLLSVCDISRYDNGSCISVSLCNQCCCDSILLLAVIRVCQGQFDTTRGRNHVLGRSHGHSWDIHNIGVYWYVYADCLLRFVEHDPVRHANRIRNVCCAVCQDSAFNIILSNLQSAIREGKPNYDDDDNECTSYACYI